MYEAYQPYLQQVPWITNNFSDDLMRELSQVMEEMNYSKKENIFLDGDTLYFVQIGHIEIFVNVPETEKQEIIMTHLKSGARFGDYGFVQRFIKKSFSQKKSISSEIIKNRPHYSLQIINVTIFQEMKQQNVSLVAN